MSFEEQLQSLEEEYNIPDSDHARELAQTVADLQD